MSFTDPQDLKNSNLGQKLSSTDCPEPWISKSRHDPDSSSDAAASSSNDRGSFFQSASNVVIHGSTFFSFSADANSRPNVPNPQLDAQSIKDELDEDIRMHSADIPNENQNGKGEEKHSVKRSAAEQFVSDSDATPGPMRRSCDVYYQHIAVKRRGSPLWIPEPNKNLHITYQRKGMAIGDVGIITDSGGFDFLFNICLPLGHPINPEQLPDNYSPFPIRVTDFRRYSEFKTKSYLSSASVKKSHYVGDSSNLSFETSASEGAILALPVGLNSEDLRNMRGIKRYTAFNAEHWYKYVLDILGCDVRNGDIRIVVGYDKTSAWGIATLSNSSAQKQSVHLTLRSVEEDDIGRTYEWEHSSMAEVRAGPDSCDLKALRRDDPDELGAEYENQCLFVRTLNVMLQDNIWKKLKSEVGEVEVDGDPGYTTYIDSLLSAQISPKSSSTFPPPQSSTGYTNNQCLSFSTLPTALIGHPSGKINEMLLKHHPNSRTAITEDWDWISVIQEDDFILPPPDEIYARVMKSFITREEEDIVFLENIERPARQILAKDSSCKSGNADTSLSPLDSTPPCLTPSTLASSARGPIIAPARNHSPRNPFTTTSNDDEIDNELKEAGSLNSENWSSTPINSVLSTRYKQGVQRCSHEAISTNGHALDLLSPTISGTTKISDMDNTGYTRYHHPTVSDHMAYYSQPTANYNAAPIHAGYRICDQCGSVETPTAKYRLCGGCMTTQYCSTECQKLHWPSHKALCQHTAAQLQPASSKTAATGGFDENIVKNLRKFASAHTALLVWVGFQALQLKRVPANIRANALVVALSFHNHPESHRRFSVIDTRIIQRGGIRDPLIQADIQRREDRCRKNGGIGTFVVILECGNRSQILPFEVETPAKMGWDIRDDWAQILHHFVESGRTDFKPISTTPKGIIYG